MATVGVKGLTTTFQHLNCLHTVQHDMNNSLQYRPWQCKINYHQTNLHCLWAVLAAGCVAVFSADIAD